jgi:hypothetical protein
MTKHAQEGRSPKTLRLTATEVGQIQAMADEWGCTWSVAACRLIELGERIAPQEWPPARMPKRRTWQTAPERTASEMVDDTAAPTPPAETVVRDLPVRKRDDAFL